MFQKWIEYYDKIKLNKLREENIVVGYYVNNKNSLKTYNNMFDSLIIDNYIDKSILDMLVYKKENVNIVLVTSSHYLTKTDINKFNKQYPNLNIKYSNIFHDRFIIIDNTLYHCGASLKDLGKKCFAISKMEDLEYIKKFEEI